MLLLVAFVLLTILACDGTGVSVDFSKQIDTWTKIDSVPAGVVPPWIQEPDGSKPVGPPGKVSVTGLAPQEAKGKQVVIYLSNSPNPEASKQEEGQGVVGDDLHWKLPAPVQLVPGQNFLHATVLNDSGQPGAFSTVGLWYNDGKVGSGAADLPLSIKSPVNGSVAYQSSFELSGTAKPGVEVQILTRAVTTPNCPAPTATSTTSATKPQQVPWVPTDAWGRWKYPIILAGGRSWTITAQTTGVSKPETSLIIVYSSPGTQLTDDQLKQIAQQWSTCLPQPQAGEECLRYAQDRNFGEGANGNTGAFNLLYEDNDAKLVGPDGKLLDFSKILTYGDREKASVGAKASAPLKGTVIPLKGKSDLTGVLQRGDFIIWDKDNDFGADPGFGHIAVVELVQQDRVVISQANYNYPSGAWMVLTTAQIAKKGKGMYASPPHP
ncbi:MAG: CHAP domain-containing protein [Chloroflexi bacterium]|nr:CHAP domain-containing protein [Chloroflexota bacterium]